MSEILPGCEPWSSEGGEVGVLLVHGFTGNPASMRPLAEHLAAEGFTVDLPLFPGHGTRWQDLQTATVRECLQEVVAAFERLRARTTAQIVAGLSGGAVVALRLAETRGDDLAGVVLINPSYDWKRDVPALRLLPILKWVLPSLPGTGNDIAKPGMDEKAYDRYAPRFIAEGLPFQRTVRKNLHRVTVPTLVFTSRHDHVVNPQDSQRILERISSTDKEQVWLERSYHVAPLDYDADLIFEHTAKFVRRVTGA